MLENAGYTVTTAADGEEALALLDREHIDLVVLDVMMPKLDGSSKSSIRWQTSDFKAQRHFGKPLSEHPAFRQLEQSFNRGAEDLELTEMLQSDFINNFSHEFKTPIVSIAGFAKLLRRGNLTDVQKEEYLEVIGEESLRLSAMATNVQFNLSEQIRGAVLLLAEKMDA